MANTPDLISCIDGGGELLPLSPFCGLSYHFGMLLGVDDFETEQAYHRGKHRLHNAWLHREGVVWGFNVSVNQKAGEIQVSPGLALDAAGHELHLEGDACLNVGKWFDKHKDDPDFNIDSSEDGKKKFDAHVVVRFKPCLTRQVPALMEPCNNAGSGTAYSRVFETVEIFLRPNRAPIKQPPYHLLRVLFGLEAAATDGGGTVLPVDQAVLDARAAIQALPAGDRPPAFMAAFHRFAALDEINLSPAKSEDNERTLLFPGREDEAVVLANVNALTLTKDNDAWVLSGGNVDTSVRPSHVSTTTIQDLLCGCFCAGQTSPADAGIGPRIKHKSVIFLTERAVMFGVDKPLSVASVTPAAFSVTWFQAEKGWQRVNVTAANYTGDETQTVVLDLDSDLSGRVRLIAFGTGPTPLLGADLVPLAGAVGGPEGNLHEGHDFAHMADFVKVVVKSSDPAGSQPEPPIEPASEKVASGSENVSAPPRGRPSRTRSTK
jgi:hypothetical protein